MPVTRRDLFRVSGAAAVVTTLESMLAGQGRCRDGYGTPGCPLPANVATAPVPPVFAPTGWRTVALDHVTFDVGDYKKEAAFYIALMGWTLREDDGKQAVLDAGSWGSVVFRQVREQTGAVVRSFGFAIEPWDARQVDAELKRRGLSPEAESDGRGFESFHVADPNGFDLQIGNANGLARARRMPATAKLTEPLPFAPTGWKTVWLDHFSYNAADYKRSASFYTNLLGWKATYDEGSQHELMIGEVGDIIVRGGNPNDPNGGRSNRAQRARIDHISFGISPWDTDGVKAELEKRELVATVDTSSAHPGPDGKMVPDDIHTAPFRSYHTRTPNGYNLQISWVTHENRLALANAVKPRKD